MTFIKVFMILAVFLPNCHREKLLVREAAMKPPVFSGTFIVKTRVTDLFSEPSLESSKLARLSSNEEVKISAEIRKVTDSVKNRSILLLMVQYRDKIGWVNSKHLGFPHSATRQTRLFKSQISDFSSGCLMAESTERLYKSCSGCGTLEFFPWGGFSGSLGCDDHLNGTWQIQDDRILVEAEGATSCGHFIGTDPSKDKDYAKKCAEFQVKTYKTYKFNVFKNNKQWLIQPRIKLGSGDEPLELYVY